MTKRNASRARTGASAVRPNKLTRFSEHLRPEDYLETQRDQTVASHLTADKWSVRISSSISVEPIAWNLKDNRRIRLTTRRRGESSKTVRRGQPANPGAVVFLHELQQRIERCAMLPPMFRESARKFATEDHHSWRRRRHRARSFG